MDSLLHRSRHHSPPRHVDLRPLRRRRSPGWFDGVDHPERFSGADLSILHLLHDAIAQAVEIVKCTRVVGLRDNVRSRGRPRVMGDRGSRTHGAAGAAVCAGGELSDRKRRGGGILNKVFGRPGRGHLAGLFPQQIGRKQREWPVGNEPHGGGQGLTVVHVVLVERGEDRARVGAGVAETIRAHVETAVIPAPKFAIIRKGTGRNRSLVHAHCVKPPAARHRVRGFRCGKALVNRRIPSGRSKDEREVGQDPAIGQLVVDDHGVAERIRIAQGTGRAA
jgi:hypothetical protein